MFFFSATKLISTSGKALGTKLTFTKIKKIPPEQPYLQTQDWVTANEQFFKSSLISFYWNFSKMRSDIFVNISAENFFILDGFVLAKTFAQQNCRIL